MSTRRGFLQLLGMTPIAAKGMAEKAVAELSDINITGTGTHAPTFGDNGYPSAADAKLPGGVGLKQGLKLIRGFPNLVSELESHLFESFKIVHGLDYDLANKKSFSLAAKIAFQRQRNVERERERLVNGKPYMYEREHTLLMDLAKRAMGLPT